MNENPYQPTSVPKGLTKEETRRHIIYHPDAGPLAVWTYKHPIISKVTFTLVIVAIVLGIAAMVHG